VNDQRALGADAPAAAGARRIHVEGGLQRLTNCGAGNRIGAP
jgi:hypothetical protein